MNRPDWRIAQSQKESPVFVLGHEAMLEETGYCYKKAR